MNFKLMMSLIGIVLIAYNILAFIDDLAPIFRMWRIPIIYYYFLVSNVDIAIMYSLFLLTIIPGLALYIIGRKEFSNRVRGSKIASGLLIFLGLILAFVSLAFLGVYISSFLIDIAKSGATQREIAVCLLIFVWGGLGFISSVLWLVDGAKVGEDKVLPLK